MTVTILVNSDDGLRVTADVPAGQLTIFYDGKVNVYNDVAVDKVTLDLNPNRFGRYGVA